MNLTLKRSKCCCMSICRGCPTEIDFSINGSTIHKVKEKPEKFLGSWLTFNMKTADAFTFVKEKLNHMLSCINGSHVRDEFKIAVLTRYSLPSLRYVLTVHDLTNTQLSTLDGMTTKQLKAWLNIPAHGATLAIREFSIAVNVPLVNVVERMSARNIRATAHMSSFTSRRIIENCLISARNIRATAHAPRSQRKLNMSTTQILNSKSTGFTLFTVCEQR